MEEWAHFLIPAGGFSSANSWQVALIALILGASITIQRLLPKREPIQRYSPATWLRYNVTTLLFWVSIWIIHITTSSSLDTPLTIFRFFAHLTTAWVLIGIVTSLLHTKFWVESVAFICYFATGIFGLAIANDSVAELENLHFSIGNFRVTLWSISAGIIAFAIMLWLSLALSQVVEDQIKRVPRLSPSLKVLVTKIVRVGLIILTIAVALSSMGLNLSALTVFGGALGLGLGFGLQKVISNFVSGIILLLDNSIKPGDVIEIDGTYGWINHLRGRYASVITRDGTEHLIPNEDLITQRVINWSFTNNLVRLRVPIGVSYDSDPNQCIKLVLEATNSVDRVLKDPQAACLLKGFGESSVDLELRLWISDPSNGVANVKSKVLLKIWDSFKENNIEIPFPRRDIHIKSETITNVSEKI